VGRGLPVPARSLKARAIQLLAQREHSRVELRRKLLAQALADERDARGPARVFHPGESQPAEPDQTDQTDPADQPDQPDEGAHAEAAAKLDRLLDWLEANHYLSNQRFVESRVHARASRFGNLRIRQELAQHEVSLSVDAAASLKASELARAQAVWQRKFAGRGPDAAAPAERAKQARFLAGRGFSGEAIRRVLRDAHRQSNNGDDATVQPDLEHDAQPQRECNDDLD
jgi:regulatory protein